MLPGNESIRLPGNESIRLPGNESIRLAKEGSIRLSSKLRSARLARSTGYPPTNSDWFQWLCPGAPLQIEVKGHLNANIMA